MRSFIHKIAHLKTPHTDWGMWVVLCLFLLIPIYAQISNSPFVLTLFTRIMVYALAVLGLNWILGFGGMVSFGHALYLGVGAYAVALLSFYEIHNAWIHLFCALTAAGILASLAGLVVLRTKGIAFIMITLALAQMGYFFFISLKTYGGDDGLSISQRSNFGIGSLDNPLILYYLVWVALMGTTLMFGRMLEAPFGRALLGIRSNERRMSALGYPSFWYRWVAYIISAMVVALAGFFLANLTKFASPAYMQWQVSGDLIVMAVLGGMYTLVGPIVGATFFMLLEEWLSGLKTGWSVALDQWIGQHWLALIGVFIILIVLCLKQGLYGYYLQIWQRKAQ